MLDIVITHHLEPWEVCRRQFQMLDAQRGVDWDQIRVTVVNDGGNRLPEERLEDLSFRVQQLDIPQSGVSAARNAGIRIAQEPWIMFCDCDDCFSNVFALEDILNVLTPEAEKQFDMMWTKVWAEEYANGKHRAYMIHKKKIFVFIHGKVYRREFLLAQDIRFDESLAFNEDSCFNAKIITRIPHTRIGEISTYAPVYVWILRANSVTKEPGADDRSAIGQFHRNLLVAEETRKYRPEEYPGIVTRVSYDTYFMTRTRLYSERCKQQILREFSLWIREREHLFGRVDFKTMRQIREISRAELTEKDEDIPDDPEIVAGWVRKVARERSAC